ncbi:amidase [Arthrobacter crystallopoietes]|uniref:amidase n=1 Tax=Crystallibacter crystallopoietes TaxID=37928 RepID=UPI0011112808|nr:amidase [Arthrobacter crystallopoietes]QTG82717.1 amidase [Arthrobacter crystallopoietes]
MTEILELTAAKLVEGIRRRDFSAREAVAAHLARIDEVNPAINAVVTLDPEAAFAAADAADRLTVSGVDLPPLHGLPMTHKDTHRTKGMRTTQGSLIFKDDVPDEDDLIVARLRAAGVVATGKTNVPEFGAGSHTFNEVFGTTTNPYAPSRSAGGSSGGVAAAIAAGIQPLGEGSDMGGSLRIPASFCNVAGFRPSYGVIPMPAPNNAWAWLGRTGPMAREISDIALFMSAVAGPSRKLPTPAPLDGKAFAGVFDGDLRGVRIGWSPDFGIGIPVEPAVLEVLQRQLRVFEEAGAIVEEATPDFSEADQVFQATRATDFAAELGPLVRSHRDLIKPEVIWNVELGWSLSAQDLIEATAARTRLEASVQNFFGRYDLFLSPAAQVLPFDATMRYPGEVAGVKSRTYLDWMRSACVLSATGLPVLAVPAGFTAEGLPVGFQIAANHYQDMALLRQAKAFEDRTRCVDRRPEPSRPAASPATS